MTPSGHPSGVRPWTVWTPLGVALAARRRRLPAVRMAALVLTPVSVALVVVTTAVAVAAG